MNKLIPLFFIIIGFSFVSPVFATTCIESLSCMPTNSVTQVFSAFDTTYGSGMTLLVSGIILAAIELAIYMRTRSLAMFAVMGIYTFGAFGAILTAPYFSAQYHILIYVIALAGTSVFAMAVFKLVKE